MWEPSPRLCECKCYNLDFGDAVAVARMETRGIAEIYSYDTDVDVLATVTRVEP